MSVHTVYCVFLETFLCVNVGGGGGGGGVRGVA